MGDKTKEKAKIIKNGYDYEVLLNYDYLQRIVRHPDYQKFCEDLIFDKEGFAITDLLLLISDESEKIKLRDKERQELEKKEKEGIDKQRNLLDKIRNEFRVTEPIDPKKVRTEKYPPEFYSNIPFFEKNPFAVSLIFLRTGTDEKGRLISTPIHEGHFLLMDIDPLAIYKKQVKSGVKDYISTYKEMVEGEYTAIIPCELLRKNDILITIKIDLLADEKDIFSEIRKYINPATDRTHIKKKGWVLWNLGFKGI